MDFPRVIALSTRHCAAAACLTLLSLGAPTIVLAEVDCDGLDELAIGRKSNANWRWQVMDDASTGFAGMINGGDGWGLGHYTTTIAFGDVDGDGRDEIAIGRKSNANWRWQIRDDAAAGFAVLASGGDGWGLGHYTTTMAFGDIDGDGRDEVAIGRKSSANWRWQIRDDATAGFAVLASGGDGWGSGHYTKTMAFGDVDGDGRAELAIGRKSNANWRWQIRDDGDAGFAVLTSGGDGWGAAHYTTTMAFGDVDGDGRDEIAIGRKSSANWRWQILDDSSAGFAGLASGGDGWGLSHYTTSMAFGDIDGDGRAELAIGRKSSANWRWQLRDDNGTGFAVIASRGDGWGALHYTTSIAFGEADGDGREEIAIGRKSNVNWRWQLLDFAPATSALSVIRDGGDDWGGLHYTTALALRGSDLLVDSDGDGLPDAWETNGVDVDCDGIVDLDLASMGATPGHKDLFLEFDWVAGQEPTRAAIETMKTAFARAPVDAGGVDNPDTLPSIRLWVDTGLLADPAAREDGGGPGTCGDGIDNGGDGQTDGADNECLVGDNLASSEDGAGRGTCADGADNGGDGAADGADPDCVVGGNGLAGPIGCLDANFYAAKATNFGMARRRAFRYGISGDPADSDPCGGGRAEIGGNDFIEYNHDPGTIMHEFGHTLNLRHGGDVDDNCKPNHVSVMNYDNQFGIWVNGGPGTGQDVNGDGIGDGIVIDYSPPWRPPGARGVAPLSSLVEDDLDSATILDATDDTNQYVFVNGAGAKVRTRLDRPVDWDGDGDTADAGLSVNIDTCDAVTGAPSACCNTVIRSASQPLTGHDNWTAIAMKFRGFADSADAPVNPVPGPEPDIEELQTLRKALNTTDLEIAKTATPARPLPGGEVVYSVVVTNRGPNPAGAVNVEDGLPASVAFQDSDPDCAEDSPGSVKCALGQVPAGESKTVAITGEVDPKLICDDVGSTSIINRAAVENGQGPDTDTSNNEASLVTAVEGVRVKYVAKFICGWQKDADDTRLVRGFYASTINVHNPGAETFAFCKKLSLAYPPGKQAPGEVYIIAADQLNPTETLAVDCADVQRRLFPTGFPSPYIEGVVVIQSPRSLDVQAVYTTAALGEKGELAGQTSIDVEQIRERRVKWADAEADIEVSKEARLVHSYSVGNGLFMLVRYSVSVMNKGPSAATNVSVEDSLEMEDGLLIELPETDLDFEVSHDGTWSLESLTASAASYKGTIPRIEADDTATIAFSVAFFASSAEGQERPGVKASNTISAAGDIADPITGNNSFVLRTQLP